MTQHKTLYGLDVATQWDQILELHILNLAKEHHPDWYRWKLTNNYERAVFLKGDPVFPRETTRYLWANQNLKGKKVLEVGCSNGYGLQFLPNDTRYTGIDYDPVIIHVAKEQKWDYAADFICADINKHKLDFYDTIIAFEVVEHMDNGLEVVKQLQRHCNRLLITVPYKEPKGFWGEHHKLHGLDESFFPNFKFHYISENGFVTESPTPICETNRCNLMLCRWDNV